MLLMTSTAAMNSTIVGTMNFSAKLNWPPPTAAGGGTSFTPDWLTANDWRVLLAWRIEAGAVPGGGAREGGGAWELKVTWRGGVLRVEGGELPLAS